MNQPVRKKKEGWFSRALTLIVALAIFVIPVTFYALEPERAQWKAARAIAKYNLGEKSDAVELLEAAVEKTDDPLLQLRLAYWKQEVGEIDESLDICEDLIEWAKVNGDMPTGQGTLAQETMRIKANGLLKKGRSRQAFRAVTDAGQLYANVAGGGGIGRNNELAYYRALCEQDVGEGWKEISSVINELSGSPKGFPMAFQGQVIAACGLIGRYVDSREQCIEVIDARLQTLNRLSDEKERESNSLLYRLMKEFVPLNQDRYRTANDAREDEEQVRNESAVLNSIKALLLEDLGRNDESQIARSRVADLGLDSEELIQELADDYSSLQILSAGATFLDTRGFVAYKLGRQELALEDLDIAILASNIYQRSFDSPVQNLTDIRNVEMQISMARYSNAVLHYHRMLVHQKMGAAEKAEADKKTVIELGQEPNKDLF